MVANRAALDMLIQKDMRVNELLLHSVRIVMTKLWVTYGAVGPAAKWSIFVYKALIILQQRTNELLVPVLLNVRLMLGQDAAGLRLFGPGFGAPDDARHLGRWNVLKQVPDFVIKYVKRFPTASGAAHFAGDDRTALLHIPRELIVELNVALADFLAANHD